MLDFEKITKDEAYRIYYEYVYKINEILSKFKDMAKKVGMDFDIEYDHKRIEHNIEGGIINLSFYYDDKNVEPKFKLNDELCFQAEFWLENLIRDCCVYYLDKAYTELSYHYSCHLGKNKPFVPERIPVYRIKQCNEFYQHARLAFDLYHNMKIYLES